MLHLRCRASIGYSRNINVSMLNSEDLAMCVPWKEINARFSAASGSQRNATWSGKSCTEISRLPNRFMRQIEDIYSEIKIQCVKMFMTRDTMKTYENMRISFSSVKKNCATRFLIELVIWSEINDLVWALSCNKRNNVAGKMENKIVGRLRFELKRTKLFTWFVGKCKATIEGDDDGPRLVHA